MSLVNFFFNCKLEVVSLMLFCSNALSACVENTKVVRVCHTFYLGFSSMWTYVIIFTVFLA